MKDFDYEVMQRKNLANQAKHRKRGSKSKKCSLPSDGMSHKQWKERNGEVVEYNLNKPMVWKVFKYMPIDLQKQYLLNMRDRYGATAKAVSEMLGITPNAFSAYVRRHDIAVFPRNGGCPKSDSWHTFLRGESLPEPEAAPPQPAEAAETAEAETPTENPPKVEFTPQSEAEQPRKAGMLLNSFTLQFGGEFDPEAIRNSLAMILQKGQRVRIEINCTVEG